MLKSPPPPKKKKESKIAKNLIFHNPFNNVGRDPPRHAGVYTSLGEQIWCIFQRRCRMKLSSPYGQMLMKTKQTKKKEHVKSETFKTFENNKKWCVAMVDRYLFPQSLR